MSLPRAISLSEDTGKVVSSSEYVALSFQDRHRRRIRMTSSTGRDFLLDLPDAVALLDGTNLLLDDGSTIRVAALPEDVLDISAGNPHQLMRIAWHLGNRHLPTQLMDAKIRIAFDHVIADMVTGLGANVVRTQAPFQPEGGAYDGHDHA